MSKITVSPLPWYTRVGDRLMVPIMYVVSGTFNESPQQTHQWNNQKLSSSDTDYLIDVKGVKGTVYQNGSERARRQWKWIIPIFHMPIFGGWKKYVVIAPENTKKMWHIGWIADHAKGVSLIPIVGPVRLLIGLGDVRFFGIYPDGSQINIHVVGYGIIGDGCQWKDVPLL